MQTAISEELSTVSGARQEPLLTADQLSVGSILTGPAWRTARRVIEIDSNVIVLEKLPRPLIAPGHLHSLTLFRGAECECGYRREPVANLIPDQPQMVRTFLIVPTGDLEIVDPFTVYATSAGSPVITTDSQLWDRSRMPLIPKLLPVWSLPEPLRRVIERAEG